MIMATDDGFLSRWSRRKEQVRRGQAPEPEAKPISSDVAEKPVPGAILPAEHHQEIVHPPVGQPPSQQPALPTLADIDSLTHESDFARFVAPEVSGEVRNAALKKLFSDPHFNVMDGLDTYIDDYNKPVPLPAAMLKKLAQAAYLGLVEPEAKEGQQKPAPESGSSGNTTALEGTEEPEGEPQPAPQFRDEPVADDASAAETEAHDENPDLRLQSHHALGSPGSEPSVGENPRGQR